MVSRVGSSDFLETGGRGFGAGTLARAMGRGDIGINPAMSSNEGPWPGEARVSGTACTARTGAGGAAGRNSLGIICGGATASVAVWVTRAGAGGAERGGSLGKICGGATV